MCKYSYLLLLLLLVGNSSIAQEMGKEEQAAVALYQAGKTDEALTAFQTLLRTQPDNVNAAGAVAQLYLDKGDYAAAYSSATAALKRAPNTVFLSISAATAAIKLDNSDDALHLMDGTLAKDPNQDYAHYVRGMALDAKGQIQQAIAAYSKSILLKPDFAAVYYNRGADFYALSRYNDALPDFNKLLELDSSWSVGYNKRGLTNYALGNTDAAISDYSRTIALQPQSAIPYANRGLIYLDRKQIPQAKADFLKATSLEPGYAEGHYGLARVYNEENAFAQALPEIEKAVSLNTKMPAYLAAYCTTLTGLNLDADVIPIADRILAIDDRNTDGWMYKAAAQSNLKDYSKAIATMNAAIVKLADSYLMYALRAGIYRQQGNTGAADADDARARSLSPANIAADYKGVQGRDPSCLSGDCNNGFGTYQFPSGNKYTGNFKGRAREGQGTFYFANGEQFVGTFKGNNYENGTYTFSTGATYTGTYDAHGKPLNGVVKAGSRSVPITNGKATVPKQEYYGYENTAATRKAAEDSRAGKSKNAVINWGSPSDDNAHQREVSQKAASDVQHMLDRMDRPSYTH